MLFRPNHDDRIDELNERLRRAQAVTPDLVSDVIAQACPRGGEPRHARDAARIDAMVEAGAWSDAVLALVKLEIPQWQLRRLLYEDGEWHCTLSRAPNLPFGVDDTVDAVHDDLPLAILLAFVGVQRDRLASRKTEAQTTPRLMVGTNNTAVCCDNFA